MLTISSGHSAAYLTDAVATGRENYYSGAVAAGEPPGRWYGAGATALGLHGLVDAQDMTALYARYLDPRDPAFHDPEQWANAPTLGHAGRRYTSEDELYNAALDAEPDATAERRAELRLDAGKRARKNVAFLDATFSVAKSITVLHTAFEAQEIAARQVGDHETAGVWAAHREAVEFAIWAGNNAALDYLADHAGYSRVGHHGGAAGRYIDAHEFVVASFFQHDSRDHDPQLHIHNAILNRVQGADGEWRTLDGRGLYAHRGAAAAVAERTTEEHLARSLGVRFATRPDGKAREVLGVPAEVMELFSSRRRAITARTTVLVEAFETRFDRAPNALELDRLQRQATFATRKAKSHHGETIGERLGRWDTELRAEVAGGLARVAQDVLALAGQGPEPAGWSRPAVIETALADVQSRKSAWTASDLTRAISDALPDRLGDLDGLDLATLLGGLTAEAVETAVPIDAARVGAELLPDELRLADGRSAYEAPGRRLYATPAHVHTERVLATASSAGGVRALSTEQARVFLDGLAEQGIELGVDQSAAVRGVLTSAAAVECLVGPAGTGKSFVVGAIAQAWRSEQHRVLGLASSQIAADVLADEGLTATNIARWLAAQSRLDTAAPLVGDERWGLRVGDLVVIDESAMSNTADLAAVHDRVHAAGAKLLLVGDHRQLAAVGAGGAMALLSDTIGSYELREARRFAQPWEAAASLQLRGGDPAALAEYHKRGRLLDAGNTAVAEESAARAWLADTLAGKSSVLVVDTNENAARVNAALRAELVRLGRVNESGVTLGRDGNTAGVGDLVQARANAWHLAGVGGNRRGPVNRELLRVTGLREDGGLCTTSVDGSEAMTLPSSYVAENLALGYATTAHAAQGRTVDTAHVVAGSTTSAAALYVGLSRGRHANTAHVVTEGPDGAVRRNPSATLALTLEGAQPQRSALAEAAASRIEAASVRTLVELLSDGVEIATAERTAVWLDRLVDDGHLADSQRASLAAEDGAHSLTRLLRRAELAGHDAEQILRAAVVERDLSGARQFANVLNHRIVAATALEPVTDTFTATLPRVADARWAGYLAELAAAADARAAELGEQTAAQQPQWAIEAFGPVPDGPGRASWTRRAAVVAAHRELSDHDDPTSPLGAAPEPGRTEAIASWRAAWRALGRDHDRRDEAEMSTGQLRIRIRAWEREQSWAPRYVANELAGTHQAAASHRATAVLRRVEAETCENSDRSGDLLRQAADAEALAEILDARCTELNQADGARALWFAHTAATRAAADRARIELATREVVEQPSVTAEEWLATHRAVVAAEDPHRRITSALHLAHVAEHRAADRAAVDGGSPAAPVARTHGAEPTQPSEDVVRVPTAEETAATLARARHALNEIRQRDAAEAEHNAAEARARELGAWQIEPETGRSPELALR
jgi:conjugative relaxase-like TrwC/TraI family protein